MPVQDIDPGGSPETPGTWMFYEQGRDASTGVQLTSGGAGTFAGDVSVAGGFTQGGVRAMVGYAGKTSTTTVSNTTTETVLHTLTIDANTAAVGTAYQMAIFGLCSWPVTTAPTITFRLRIGGVAGGVIATVPITCPTTAGTSKGWTAAADLVVTATGASANWRGSLGIQDSIAGTVQGRVDASGSGVTLSSAQANDWVLTAQWSGASASNSLSCTGGYVRRQA